MSSAPRRDMDLDRMLEHELRRTLGRSVEAPDQTAVIMHRLGFATHTPAAARARRRNRAVARGAAATICSLAIAASIMLYGGSDAVRRPIESTVPAALRQDLQRQQQRLHRGIRVIRQLAPTPIRRSEPSEAPPAREVDRLAVGPVRWI